MHNRVDKRKLFASLIMGVLTLIVSLVVADHLIGLTQQPAHQLKGILAQIVFYAGLIGLPILFCKNTTWVYTLLNLPLYFILYFPIAEATGSTYTHYFLRSSRSLIALPDYFGAGITTIYFGIIQSIVFLILWNLQRMKCRKEKKA